MVLEREVFWPTLVGMSALHRGATHRGTSRVNRRIHRSAPMSAAYPLPSYRRALADNTYRLDEWLRFAAAAMSGCDLRRTLAFRRWLLSLNLTAKLRVGSLRPIWLAASRAQTDADSTGIDPCA